MVLLHKLQDHSKTSSQERPTGRPLCQYKALAKWYAGPRRIFTSSTRGHLRNRPGRQKMNFLLVFPCNCRLLEYSRGGFFFPKFFKLLFSLSFRTRFGIQRSFETLRDPETSSGWHTIFQYAFTWKATKLMPNKLFECCSSRWYLCYFLGNLSLPNLVIHES